MLKLYNFNWLLLICIIILATLGFIALYSASGSNMEPWANKQLLRFFFGIILLFFISFINIKYLYKYSYYFFFFTLILLLGVEVVGIIVGGASRWIRILGINIQPSELVKISLILALAKYYSDLRFDRIGYIRNIFVPLLFILIPFFITLKQPDLGTALMILVLGISLMFLVGVRIWKFVIGSLLILSIIPLLWNFVLKDYQKTRLISFLDPQADPLGSGYHLIQSQIALGSGGFFGKGYLKGSQAYLDFLPEKQTDFIFTLIGEEFGFIGTIFILFIYMAIILTCFYIGFKSSSNFGKYLSFGVGVNIFLYVFLNTAMVVGLAPVVGVPLPLVSYGGTVMLSVLISFGFVQNASVNCNIKKITNND